MIVKSDSLINAVTTLEAELEKTSGNHEIASITDTQILDVFRYEAPQK